MKLAAAVTCLTTVLLASLSALPAPAAAGQPALSDSLAAELVNAAGKEASVRGTGRHIAAAAIVRAQVLLDRAHFSAGEIDGAPGSNLKAALAGFQKAHDLAADGTLNAATWDALNSDPSDALIGYTVSEQDVAGPYQAVPDSMADKAKLSSLGFASIEEALGERFHVSPALLQKLNPGKDLQRVGEQIVVPHVEGAAPLPKGARIVISKAGRTLTLYDTAGKAIAQFPSSSGSDHDPLPIGQWKVNGISNKPVYWYNPKLFWDAKPGDASAKIPAGPNNPVGVAWIDLSKPHYGIHGTPVPAAIGKTQSHGCIRLTNWDVALLITAVGAGTDVVLQD
ncbi:L,D-transpeptidase family protein [Massilia sp. PWRC2]|uniref:L,D-transpeptidase family protein n=1 Tax=Massilia sp. PWRC2 TaxID=2804626 RepID=UPI003CE6BF4C